MRKTRAGVANFSVGRALGGRVVGGRGVTGGRRGRRERQGLSWRPGRGQVVEAHTSGRGVPRAGVGCLGSCCPLFQAVERSDIFFPIKYRNLSRKTFSPTLLFSTSNSTRFFFLRFQKNVRATVERTENVRATVHPTVRSARQRFDRAFSCCTAASKIASTIDLFFSRPSIVIYI